MTWTEFVNRLYEAQPDIADVRVEMMRDDWVHVVAYDADGIPVLGEPLKAFNQACDRYLPLVEGFPIGLR